MLEFLAGLYRTHADDLAMVIDRQRELLADGTITPQLDDVEAELTYLLLRHHRPSQVVEVGTYYGWSTTWILSALRDNGSGHLQSFDLVDHVCGTVPEELSTGRWTFHRGDLRETVEKVPADTGYLFVDADHGRRFARWYLEHLFGRIATGTPTSVHDVFHLPRARPFTEGSEVLRLHADRVDLHEREEHLLTRFSAAHPGVSVTRVPALAGDIADLDGLRRVGALLAGEAETGAAATAG